MNGGLIKRKYKQNETNQFISHLNELLNAKIINCTLVEIIGLLSFLIYMLAVSDTPACQMFVSSGCGLFKTLFVTLSSPLGSL